MNSYELTVVLPGSASSAKKKSVSSKIEKLVEESNGKIKKVSDWGKIELAYKIQKEETGLFLHYNLELEAKGAKNLKDKLRIESDIIRYLLVRT